uniref:Uncharacterized protein n=1 Tax=Ditylenchus dipsaci TaxID=166011 RepID=A0A915E9P7_9BILA
MARGIRLYNVEYPENGCCKSKNRAGACFEKFRARFPKICRLSGIIHPKTPNKVLNYFRTSLPVQMMVWKRSMHTSHQDREVNISRCDVEMCFCSNSQPQNALPGSGGYVSAYAAYQNGCPLNSMFY